MLNNSSPQTFIFIGRSGCGKGTQVELLEKWLKENDSKRNIFKLETGALLRNFIKDDTNHSSRLASTIYNAGGLMPEFLTTWVWSCEFVKNFDDSQHIIIDGTPRRLNEAKILDSALKFYGRAKPIIILLNVSREWAEEKLKSRHRMDDSSSDVKRRLDWFETDVVKAIEFYRNGEDFYYSVIEIDGEKTVEEVHSEIVSKLGA
ncbi:MAG: nucleoside monophosphate kinase [Candidatus Paceibacterota bacterium]|jgi:adenylate kinase family enzyme